MPRHAARGLTDKDSAHAEGISERTVRLHFANARARLRANTRAHAIAIAVAQALLDPGPRDSSPA